MAARTTKSPTKSKAKPATKSRQKKTIVRKPEVVSTPLVTENTKKTSKLYKVIVIVLILIALYFLRSLIVVSTVNGHPVYRLSVIKRLEQLGGDRIVDEIMRRYVVADELQSRGMQVTDEEIDQEIEQARQLFEAQGMSFEDALEQDNLTLDDVREISRYQRGLRMLAEAEVEEVSDEEAQAYYDENAEYYEGKKFEEVKDEIKSGLSEQELQAKEQEIITNLLAKARIVTFKEY